MRAAFFKIGVGARNLLVVILFVLAAASSVLASTDLAVTLRPGAGLEGLGRTVFVFSLAVAPQCAALGIGGSRTGRFAAALRLSMATIVLAGAASALLLGLQIPLQALPTLLPALVFPAIGMWGTFAVEDKHRTR